MEAAVPILVAADDHNVSQLPSPPPHLLDKLHTHHCRKRARVSPHVGIESIESKLKAAEERRTALNKAKVSRARSNSSNSGSRVLRVITANLQTLVKQKELEARTRLAAARRATALATKCYKSPARASTMSDAEEDGTATSIPSLGNTQSNMAVQTHMRDIVKAKSRRTQLADAKVLRAKTHLERVESKRKNVQAARQLQCWWRKRAGAAHRADIFQSSNQALQTIRAAVQAAARANADRAMQILHSREVLTAVKIVLDASLELSPSGTTIGTEASPALASSPRTFLSAIVVVHHPSFVFDADTQGLKRSMDMQRAAVRLLTALDDFSGLVQSGAVSLDSEELWDSFITFNSARLHFFERFRLWKTEDARRIATMLLASLHELEATKAHVANTAALTSDQLTWVEQIEKQKKEVLSQIRQLLGQKDSEEFLKNSGVVLPPASVTKLRSTPYTPPLTPPHSPVELAKNPKCTRTALKGGFLLPKTAKAPSSKKRPAPSPPASPGVCAYATRNQGAPDLPPLDGGALPAPAGLPQSNWQLLESVMSRGAPEQHGPAAGSLEAALHETMKRAIRDRLSREIQEGNYSTLEANLLALRAKLLGFVPKGHGMERTVVEGMDIESIFTRVGFLDEKRLVLLLQFFVGHVMQLEAPARNAETEAWLDSTMKTLAASAAMADVLPLILERLFEKMKELAHDMLKAHVDMIKATLPADTVAQYQQEALAKEIAAGTLELDCTAAWLEMLAREGSESDPCVMVRKGVIKLLEGDDIIQAEALPETLRGYVQQLNVALNEIQTIVAGEVILLGAKQVLLARIEDQSQLQTRLQQVKTKVMQALRAPDVNSGTLAVAVQEEILSHVQGTFDEKDAALLGKMVKNAGGSSDPVTSLVKRRILSLLSHDLAGDSADNGRVRTIGNTRQSLAMHQVEIDALTAALATMFGRIEALFGQIHGEILATVEHSPRMCFIVKGKKGAMVRASEEITSQEVVLLRPGTAVVVAEEVEIDDGNGGKKLRAKVVQPIKGWLTKDRLE